MDSLSLLLPSFQDHKTPFFLKTLLDQPTNSCPGVKVLSPLLLAVAAAIGDGSGEDSGDDGRGSGGAGAGDDADDDGDCEHQPNRAINSHWVSLATLS